MSKSLKALVVCPNGAATEYSSIEPYKIYYEIAGYLGNGGYQNMDKIGEMDDLTEILRSKRIARVIIDYADGNYNDIASFFSSAYYMETLFLVNDRSAPNKRGFRILPTIFDKNYIISIKHRGLFSTILKRFVDFVLAGAALVLTFPYAIFKILKARLKKMKPVSEVQIVTIGEKEGKMKIDPSLSRPPFNRSFWALLSVLKGDLCLYGTTITTMEEYKSNLNSIPGYWRKFLVKPGMFGPGYSGKTPLERFKLDLEYMEKTSTWGDFWMIVKSLIGISPVKTEEL